MAQEIREKYINPYTDFGFKKLFGTEMNKDLLISFLNALFMGHRNIKDIRYLPTEHFGAYGNRRAIFDVYCEDENGGKFIVEMDTLTKKVFYDKLTYIYLEMPKFNKTEDQLETMFDKWLFVLRNLSRLFERPKALQEKIFTKLFEQAEIARFTPEERRGYEDSIKAYRDINNAINTAKKEAKEEGKAEANLDNARKMKADGMSAELIAKYTSLSVEEIKAL